MDPASCHFENQEKDEKIILLLRAHPITNLVWVASTLLAAVVGLGVFLVLPALIDTRELFSSLDLLLFLFVWLLLLAGFAIERYLSWFFNVNIVTNKKIIDMDFFQIFYKKISQTALENIQDVTTKTGGVFQNHFDYGNVLIQTAGEARNFEFTHIPDPEGVQKKVIALAEQRRKELGLQPL